ncbi:DUF4157 domain-containing protein [Streptomyces sp. NPDC087859]|uniref:DUF4157 domain-containing protein n=1 Tax=Streptomyces sp. NPDC087859 TaxID=3365812 RepID=UPI0037F933C6
MTGRLRRNPEAAVARAPGPEPDLREKAATRVPDAESVLREASVTPASPADHHAGAHPADGPTPAGRGLLAQELTHVVARMADGGAQEPSEREAERTADEVAQGHHVGPPRESPDTGPDPERQPTSLTEVLSDPGPGQPLPAATRDLLESRMGADLGDVRLHTDHRANTAAADLEARAFTYGDHVYLAADSSPQDIRLMAHEATHVLQQRGGEPRVHRAAKKPDDGSSIKGNLITLDKVRLPKWKIGGPAGLMTPTKDVLVGRAEDTQNAAGDRDTAQREKWDTAVRPAVQNVIKSWVDRADRIAVKGEQLYFFAYRATEGYVIGKQADVIRRIGRPAWDSNGIPHLFDVDHFQETQIGGEDNPDKNYWLLDAATNQAVGGAINEEINSRIRQAFKDRDGAAAEEVDPQEIRRDKKYEIRIAQIVPGLPKFRAATPTHWTRGQIEAGRSADTLTLLSEAQARKRGLIGPDAASQLLLFTSAYGGAAVRIPWMAKNGKPTASESGFKPFPGFRITDMAFDGKTGFLKGVAFNGSRWIKDQACELALEPFADLPQAARVPERDLERAVRRATMRRFSPIDVVAAELSDVAGLRIRGVLHPTIPMLKGASVDIVVEGEDVSFEKTFVGGDLTLPPPVRITESALTVSLGTRGLGISGQVLFSVDRLGHGTLGADASTGDGFGLRGGFDFDSDLFEKAQLDVRYHRKSEEDFSFGGKGILAIGPNKVRGIRKASVTAAFENDAFSASGTAELDIPGVKSGTFEVRQDPKEGFAATGAFQLADNIPGIRSGELSASVVKNPVDNRWKISARGSAVPAIPGVDAHITAQYDDGAFTLEGSAAYAKGMLNGSLLIGVTNRPVTPEGQPAGPPGKDLTAYGEGSVTARLAPWLQGTVGIRILRRGEVELVGTIALPDTLKLFEARNLERNILRIGLDIPIVGVSVLGHRVGIFATISGALDADAGIGPGELRKLALAITYNPAHEDQTKVTGDARLFIPAHAGLRLSVRGALGAGIPLVSAEAGLEIGGRLGIEGAVDASLHIDWTPAKGLVLDAEAKVSAEPAFTFDVAGYVLVEADLLLRTVELYSKRWELAKVAYGSGLRIGLTFPLHYEQGKPFEPSLTDARLELPEIDPRQVIGDLVRRIA